MVYTYDRWIKSSNGLERLDTTTNFNEINESDTIFPRYVCITDNITYNFVKNLTTSDDYHDWQTKLERDFAWNPRKNKWEPFEELQELTDDNLKTKAAVGKPTMSSVPVIAIQALGKAMEDGSRKYGRYNWRETGVTASVFYDAMMRHLLAWYNGEDLAQDSQVEHLAHIMANCAILLDAKDNNILKDDR
jgi:hypothetical protein